MSVAVGILVGVLLGYLIGRRHGPRVKPTYISPLHTGQPSTTATFVGSYPRQSASWLDGSASARNGTLGGFPDRAATIDFGSTGLGGDTRPAVDNEA
jgi:hypothetical protein